MARAWRLDARVAVRARVTQHRMAAYSGWRTTAENNVACVESWQKSKDYRRWRQRIIKRRRSALRRWRRAARVIMLNRSGGASRLFAWCSISAA